MKLRVKTTILFSRELHQRLSWLAQLRGTSLSELVRAACIERYGHSTVEDRLTAVRTLRDLRLPVSSPRTMKRQSIEPARASNR